MGQDKPLTILAERPLSIVGERPEVPTKTGTRLGQGAVDYVGSALKAEKNVGSGILSGSGVSSVPSFLQTALSQNPITTATDLVKSTVAPLARVANIPQAYREHGVTGALNEAAASIPILGPGAEHASQLTKSEDPEERQRGYGEVIGLAVSLGLTEALQAIKAARSARNAGRVVSDVRIADDLLKAVPPGLRGGYARADIERVSPYLSAEHASHPITNVQELVSAADSAITQIEEHVNSYIQANPTDRIRTSPLGAAQRILANSERSGDMAKGMRALRDLGLDQPMTLAEADAKRLRLNQENKAAMAKNQYDRETARATDPLFAAREAAADALRDGIYQQLEERGVPGVRHLRQDEGALIKVRNAAMRQVNNGDKNVGGTGRNSMAAKIARAGIPAATTGVGSMIAGTPGAITGGVVGMDIARRMTPANLTRDALIERAFSRMRKVPGATYPDMPPSVSPAGLLPSHPTPLPSGRPDPSFVRSVPAMNQPPSAMRLLPSHESGIPLRAAPDRSRVSAQSARGVVVRDPKTGRFRRMFTSEAQP